MKTRLLIGIIVGVVAMGLAIYWYDWKLAVVIFLAIYANNLERVNKQ